jgi:BirA family biotin operon repressor/biotin-[acetyl-CoA-carboxylase] ligase
MEYRLIEFEELSSTNDFARDRIDSGESAHGDVIVTNYQSKGRGQGIASWISEASKNLLFSMILHPENLPAEKYFYVSMITALSVKDCLEQILPAGMLRIKWPNDIYAGQKKIAGLLIQNDMSNNQINNSIIGIGLNVNQTSFPYNLPNPVSVKNILGTTQLIDVLLNDILRRFTSYYHDLSLTKFEQIKSLYTNSLFQLNETKTYEDHKNEEFSGKIRGVEDDGRLIVDVEGTCQTFEMKSIRYLL